MSILQKIYSEFIKKILSDDTVKEIAKFINTVDPWKWGSPLTKGEAHYINEVVVKEFYRPNGPNQERTAINLLKIYEDELEDDFAYFRRGWVAEYMGEVFGENEFRRILFLIGARVPGGGAVVNAIETANREPGSPNKFSQALVWSTMWASFFFYFSAVIIGYSQRLMADPMSALDPGIFPIILLWVLSYSKWYGKYGMYIFPIGTQSFLSAMATVGMWVLSIRVGLAFFPLYDMADIPLFCGWYGGSLFPLPDVGCASDPMAFLLFVPQPLLLGTGHLIKGMGWPNVLLLWGLSGVGNIFYGEWVEAQSELGKIHKQRKQDLKDFVRRLKGG